MSKDVGRSWRTYAKHDLMSSFVGKESGAAGSIPVVQRCGWIDLSAGDGVVADDRTWATGCSPGILAGHAAKARKPVVVWLYEIQAATYDRLIESLAAQLPVLGYQRLRDDAWVIPGRVTLVAHNASGKHAPVDWIGRGDAVLALNDPNAITEWAMRESFAAEIAERTPWFRSLSTMGCNPAGLKRLPLDERLNWFNLIGEHEKALPRHRDLLLAAIERDDAQWAYLLGEAEKWRAQAEKVVETAFRRYGRTVAQAWCRREPIEFEAAKELLFLTKKERGEVA